MSEASPQARARVAVLVPCYNESAAIATVVRDFRQALPAATVFVYDNASLDDTAAIAASAGAVVREVQPRGKGNVVRRLFADVDADIYVLVDGDSTYDAVSAPSMIALLQAQGLDMVVGARHAVDATAFRPGHRWGNRALTRFLGWLFGQSCEDVLSGYRVFSRRYVKSFPALGDGWGIDPEMIVHALELKMPIGTISTPYRARPEGSTSKIDTYPDGARLVWAMVRLFQAERPLIFYGAIASVCALASVGVALPLLETYLETGLVPRFPTAILATGLMIFAALSGAVGLTLNTVTRGRREAKLLAYLREPGPPRPG